MVTSLRRMSRAEPASWLSAHTCRLKDPRWTALRRRVRFTWDAGSSFTGPEVVSKRCSRRRPFYRFPRYSAQQAAAAELCVRRLGSRLRIDSMYAKLLWASPLAVALLLVGPVPLPAQDSARIGVAEQIRTITSRIKTAE